MGWSDEDLDESGYIQARSLASRLADLSISRIYTSPLKRAYNTASVLAAPHGLEPELLDDLKEIQIGDWQGLHRDEIKQRWPELWRDWRVDPSILTLPNGESLNDVRERIVNAFNRIVSSSEGNQVIIVSHGAAIKAFVAYILGVSNKIYNSFDISNASLSVIQVIGGNLRLVMLNDTSHLEE